MLLSLPHTLHTEKGNVFSIHHNDYIVLSKEGSYRPTTTHVECGVNQIKIFGVTTV